MPGCWDAFAKVRPCMCHIAYQLPYIARPEGWLTVGVCRTHAQVFLHLSFMSPSGAVASSTRSEHGGAGHPRPFVLGKGQRMPRGLELGVLGEAMRYQLFFIIICGSGEIKPYMGRYV